MKQKIILTTIGFMLAFICFAALSSNTGSKFSGKESYDKGDYNLVEKYYQDLVNISPELKLLETELRDLQNKEQKLKNEFYEYDNRSREYYQDARAIMNSISDSSLKRKMLNMITNSNNNYISKTSDLNNALKTMTVNDAQINDYHRVLKLVKSTGVIEKYQNDYKPAIRSYEEIIKEQNAMVGKIKTQTPTY